MYEVIVSKSNEKIKTVRKLAEKKYRQQYGLFVLEGHKLVSDYVCSGGVPVRLFVAEDVLEKYGMLIQQTACGEVYRIPRDLYLYISDETAPQGIMAVCPIQSTGEYKAGRSIILESIRDVGNLGTVIRTAVAFGIDNIVLSEDCADLYNPKTLRATMGALFFANIIVVNSLPEFVCKLVENGSRVFAAMPAGDAVDIRSIGFKETDCIVIGNEGNGISAELVECCSACVTIPMCGKTESLNASSAASVLMWELVRRG